MIGIQLNKISYTKILIIINILIFLIMYFPLFNLNGLFRQYFISSGIMSYDLLSKSYTTVFSIENSYRLITANFLHSGPTHLVMNMMGLYILGEPTESVIGRKNFILIYILSALGTTMLCAAVNILFNPFGFEPVLGASGAVLGIGGCLAGIAVYRKINNIYDPFQIDYMPLLIMLGLNIFVGLFPGISLTGHLGGIVSGFGLGYFLARKIEQNRFK